MRTSVNKTKYRLTPCLAVLLLPALAAPVFAGEATNAGVVAFEIYRGIISDNVPKLPVQPAESGLVTSISRKFPYPPGDGAFTLRFTGRIAITNAADYRFFMRSDDPSFLFVDSKMIVNNGGWHGVLDKEGVTNLNCGLHTIEAIYCHKPGGNEFFVEWQGPAFGRQPIPTSLLSAVTVPTDGKVNDVEPSVRRGFYDRPFDAGLFCRTPGATIVYTLDGGNPLYSTNVIRGASVRIDPDFTNGVRKATGCVTLRAAAVKAGMEPSDVVTHTYVFLDKVLEQSDNLRPPNAIYSLAMDPAVDPAKVREGLRDIPTLSIAAPEDDLFGPYGLTMVRDRPRREFNCSVELIYPPKRKFDSFKGFQIDCGIHIQGGVGVWGGNHKNSWILSFDDEFGPRSLQYPFFESAPFLPETAADRFNQLMLRAGFNDSWGASCNRTTTYLRDPFSRILQLQQGGIAGHDVFVHLYLNGRYWGLYNAVERQQESFMATYLGGNPGEYFNGGNQKKQQFTAQENQFFIERQGTNCRSRDFNVLKSCLDLDQFIDHKLICGMSGLNDTAQWYHGNRILPQPGPIYLFNWDFEFTWGGGLSLGGDTSQVNLGELMTPTMTEMMINNGRFRTLFHDKVYRSCFNDGALTTGSLVGTWDKLAAYVEKAIYAEAARWGDEHANRADPKAKAPDMVEIWKATVQAIRANMFMRRDALITALRNNSVEADPASGGWLPPDRRVRWYPIPDAPLFKNEDLTIAGSVLHVTPGYRLSIRAAASNMVVYYTTDGRDPENLENGQAQGVNAGSNATFTVNATQVVKARSRTDAGEWSALREAAFFVPGEDYSGLRINEIMYNPLPENARADAPIAIARIDASAPIMRDGKCSMAGLVTLTAAAPAGIWKSDYLVISGASNTANNGTFEIENVATNLATMTRLHIYLSGNLSASEMSTRARAEFVHSGEKFAFLEIKNTGKKPVGLAGVRFTRGVKYSFKNESALAPGEIAVLAGSPWFNTRYPKVKVYGYYEPGRLNSRGDTIELRDEFNDLVTRVRYDSSAPWPQSADGLGRSLVPVNTNAGGSQEDPRFWTVSASLNGSPGEDDRGLPAAPRILVNEVMAHTGPPQVNAVELFNATDRTVNLSGWRLARKDEKTGKWSIPAGESIGPGQYRVFYEAHYEPSGSANLVRGKNNSGIAFTLNPVGDSMYIVSPDGSYRHGWEFHAMQKGESLGRYVNSVGEENFVRTTGPTPGRKNKAPLVGPVVITEIMYHPWGGVSGYPATADHKFIELKNISGKAVKMENSAGDTWKLTGVKFMFPQTMILQPGQMVVLTEDTVTEDAFREKCRIPAGVFVFQFKGKLSRNGETIRLMMPADPMPAGPQAGQVGYILVDEVGYRNEAPWPAEAAGKGVSLERKADDVYGNDPANWRAGTQRGGTPGR